MEMRLLTMSVEWALTDWLTRIEVNPHPEVWVNDLCTLNITVYSRYPLPSWRLCSWPTLTSRTAPWWGSLTKKRGSCREPTSCAGLDNTSTPTTWPSLSRVSTETFRREEQLVDCGYGHTDYILSWFFLFRKRGVVQETARRCVRYWCHSQNSKRQDLTSWTERQCKKIVSHTSIVLTNLTWIKVKTKEEQHKHRETTTE